MEDQKEEWIHSSKLPEHFKLLPCPFCGSTDIYYKKYQHAVGERWSVVCGGCIAEIDCGYAEQKSTARDLWNKRTPTEGDKK